MGHLSHQMSIIRCNFALKLNTQCAMKKVFVLIFIIAALFAFRVTASAKDKAQYPQVTLTLNDSTILEGYLRCDLHGVDKKISVSETIDGKKTSYKVEDINTLAIIYPDGDSITFHPIYVWDGFRKKIAKTPVLASICYSSDNITCYMTPGMYVKSTAPVPSNYFQSYTTKNRAWIYYKRIKSESDLIKYFYTFIPSKKTPKLKSILKDIKNNFRKEDFRYIQNTVESKGITAEEITEKPWVLLEILDKHLNK